MGEKILIAIGAVVVGAFVVILVGAVMAVPVMWLWNGVMPQLFTTAVARPIDYWNAWGLMILCGLLFNGSSSSSSRND